MGSYFIDNPGNAVGTNTGNGANDSLSYLNGAYFETDFLGGDAAYAFITLGNAGIGLNTPGGTQGVPPPGFANTDIAAHPGIGWVYTSTVNLNAAVQASVINNTSGDALLNITPGSAGIWTFQQVFAFASTTSNSSDRFNLYVGPFDTFGTALNGWALTYTDNANSGKFQFGEYAHSGTAATTIATNITPVPKTWYRLQTTVNPSTAQVVVYLNVLGAASTQIWSGTSPCLSAGTTAAATMGGLLMQRTATSAGTAIGALIDYASVRVSATGRQW